MKIPQAFLLSLLALTLTSSTAANTAVRADKTTLIGSAIRYELNGSGTLERSFVGVFLDAGPTIAADKSLKGAFNVTVGSHLNQQCIYITDSHDDKVAVNAWLPWRPTSCVLFQEGSGRSSKGCILSLRDESLFLSALNGHPVKVSSDVTCIHRCWYYGRKFHALVQQSAGLMIASFALQPASLTSDEQIFSSQTIQLLPVALPTPFNDLAVSLEETGGRSRLSLALSSRLEDVSSIVINSFELDDMLPSKIAGALEGKSNWVELLLTKVDASNLDLSAISLSTMSHNGGEKTYLALGLPNNQNGSGIVGVWSSADNSPVFALERWVDYSKISQLLRVTSRSKFGAAVQLLPTTDGTGYELIASAPFGKEVAFVAKFNHTQNEPLWYRRWFDQDAGSEANIGIGLLPSKDGRSLLLSLAPSYKHRQQTFDSRHHNAPWLQISLSDGATVERDTAK